MSNLARWEGHYESGDTPWETGQPSSELRRVVAEVALAPCRAAELGCGTGTNAVWLAGEGFDVTAIDLSPLAVGRARQRAAAAGVAVRFLTGDVLAPPAELTGPFDFVFDRGCYHVVRRDDVAAYLGTLGRLARPGSLLLVLAGNARRPHEPGPPVVSEEELHRELGSLFDVVRLREIHFDRPPGDEEDILGWSYLGRRREEK
jgi:SAM-dependent methyltransferase